MDNFSIGRRIVGLGIVSALFSTACVSEVQTDAAGNPESVESTADTNGAEGEVVTACSGTACNGKDPAAQYCSPGTIISSGSFYNAYGVHVGTLQRKKGCNAYWAKVTFDTPQAGIVYMKANRSLTRYPTTGDIFTLVATPSKWIGQAYSSMWASGAACVDYQYSGSSSNTFCLP